MFKFSDLYNAYEEADFCRESGTRALINVAEEKIVFIPGDLIAEPEEIEEAEQEIEIGEWFELPDKYELHLEKELVFRFAAENLSGEDFYKVERIFSHRGAYGNWKDFLEDRTLLKQWYDFSENAKIEALKNWLTDMEIPFDEKSAETSSANNSGE